MRASITPPPYGQASQPRHMGMRLSPAVWASVLAPPYGHASRPAIWASITPRRAGMHLALPYGHTSRPAVRGCISAPPYGQASRPAVWAYITPCRTGIHLSPAVRAYAASWAACTSERRCCGAGSSTCAHRHGIALCRHTSEIHLAPISPKNIPLSIIGKGDACFYSICSGAVIISGSGGKMFSSKTQM